MQFDQFREVMTDTECLAYCKEMLRTKGLVIIQEGKWIAVKRYRVDGILYATYNLGTLLEDTESGYFDRF